MNAVAAAVPNIPRVDWAAHPRPRALQAHDRTLDAHLDVEEEAVVPLLLALDPEEFAHYYRSPLSLLISADRR